MEKTPMTAEGYFPDQPVVPGADVIYRPKGNAGEYAPLATNPWKGCGHSCAYCLSPDTLIQMADGTAIKLANVKVGDDLIGIDKRHEQRRSWNYSYSPSRVLAKIDTLKPAHRVTLANGQSAICSADHRWLTERGWKFTKNLTLNNEIRVLGPAVETPTADDEYQRGYLAGVIRGDGTLKRYDYSGRYRRSVKNAPQKTDVQYHFRLAMKDVEALDRASNYLEAISIETTRFSFQHGGPPIPAIRNHSRTAFETLTSLVSDVGQSDWLRGFLSGVFDAEGGTTAGVIRIHNKDADLLSLIELAFHYFGFSTIRDVVAENGCTAIRMVGGLSEIVRFFNLTAPAISRKFPLEGSALRGSSRIVGIEPLGNTIPMIDITTSTENFVANGMISHNCYVPAATHIGRPEFNAGAVFRGDDYMARLRRDIARYQKHMICADPIAGQIFITFSSDPFHLGDLLPTRMVMSELIAGGLAFCTLSKGGSRALQFIRMYRPERDAYACTLTTLDDRFSRKWEPKAALPDDRIRTLKTFHDAGIFTWVSLEPTLDVEASLEIVRDTYRFVDLYKIGRANYLKEITRTTDWRDYTVRMIGLCQDLGVRHYVKRDLQEYLPAGYWNPLRVPQHH